MATSADHDDEHNDEHEHEHEHDKDDEKDDAEDDAPPPKKAAAAVVPASAKPKRSREDDEDDEDEAPRPKPTPKTGARPKARGPGASKVAGPRKGAPAQSGSLGKSVLLFFVIVIGLGAGFAILGREQPAAEVARPKWSVGQTVDVEVTLVKTDRQELACWSPDELGGKHCAFESDTKPWSKGTPGDDKTLLKPYTTSDRMQFVAAGLWAEPALAPEKLPNTRFTAKCKLKVEGTMKTLGIRWASGAEWSKQDGWYGGTISNCAMN